MYAARSTDVDGALICKVCIPTPFYSPLNTYIVEDFSSRLTAFKPTISDGDPRKVCIFSGIFQKTGPKKYNYNIFYGFRERCQGLAKLIMRLAHYSITAACDCGVFVA